MAETPRSFNVRIDASELLLRAGRQAAKYQQSIINQRTIINRMLAGQGGGEINYSLVEHVSRLEALLEEKGIEFIPYDVDRNGDQGSAPAGDAESNAEGPG